MNRFTKVIIATATAVALASSLAAPVRAGDDTAKILAGIIGVAILGAVISDLDDNDRHRRAHPRPLVPPTRSGHGYHVQPTPRPLPPQVQRYMLPSKCVRAGNIHGGNALLGRGCLRKNFVHAEALPGSCGVKYWNQKRSDVRRGYSLNCLQRHGYQMAGH